MPASTGLALRNSPEGCVSVPLGSVGFASDKAEGLNHKMNETLLNYGSSGKVFFDPGGGISGPDRIAIRTASSSWLRSVSLL